MGLDNGGCLVCELGKGTLQYLSMLTNVIGLRGILSTPWARNATIGSFVRMERGQPPINAVAGQVDSRTASFRLRDLSGAYVAGRLTVS